MRKTLISEHLFLFCCAAIVLIACRGQAPTDQYPEISKLGDKYYEAYLNGDINQAQQSLLAGIQLFEEAPNITPAERAGGVGMGYTRLFVLELRAGNKKLAHAALIGMQYWNLRSLELQGKPTEDAISEVESFPTNKIIGMIEKGDRENNSGRPPNYLRYLSNRN
jgi:hypothetical protein